MNLIFFKLKWPFPWLVRKTFSEVPETNWIRGFSLELPQQIHTRERKHSYHVYKHLADLLSEDTATHTAEKTTISVNGLKLDSDCFEIRICECVLLLLFAVRWNSGGYVISLRFSICWTKIAYEFSVLSKKLDLQSWKFLNVALFPVVKRYKERNRALRDVVRPILVSPVQIIRIFAKCRQRAQIEHLKSAFENRSCEKTQREWRTLFHTCRASQEFKNCIYIQMISSASHTSLPVYLLCSGMEHKLDFISLTH